MTGGIMNKIVSVAVVLLLCSLAPGMAEAGYVKGEKQDMAKTPVSISQPKTAGATVSAAGAQNVSSEKIGALGPNIKVGLITAQRELSVQVLTDCLIEKDGKKWMDAKKGSIVSAAARGSGIAINGKETAGMVFLVPLKDGGPVFKVKGTEYRGRLSLFRPAGIAGVTAVNVLPMEEYICGVVPDEVSSSWAKDALRAQAVAARTYAMFNRGNFKTDGYDVTDDTRSQAYGGYTAETPESNAAVSDTKGLIMTSEGKPIDALFHANGGGYTENSENVWGTVLPYLRGVPELKSQVINKPWTVTVRLSDFARKLDNAGQGVGAIRSIGLSALKTAPDHNTDRGVSGRVKYMVIKGTRGQRKVSGNSIQSIFGLNSTLFDIAVKGNSLVITGYGEGHGLGMSQWGAEAMAEANPGAKEYYKTILTHYYSGIKIDKAY